MNKSRKHYTEQKKIQKSLYCMITYICNFRKYKANLQWQKVDQFSRVNGVGVGGRGHKGTFWSDENVHLMVIIQMCTFVKFLPLTLARAVSIIMTATNWES